MFLAKFANFYELYNVNVLTFLKDRVEFESNFVAADHFMIRCFYCFEKETVNELSRFEEVSFVLA